MAFALLNLTIFIMFFQPTYVFPELLPYAPLRNTALAALFFYLISNKKNISSEKFFTNKINRYFVVFVVVQIVSASRLWLMHGFEVFNFWLKYGIVYYLIVKTATSVKRIKLIILSIVLGIAYLSYFSITQFVVKYVPGMRAAGFGWYENANDLSVILVSIIPISYYLFETSYGFLKGVFYLILTGVFSFNILFTGSRNGLLGLFTVGILSIILSKISKTIRISLAVLLCLSIISIGLASVLSRSDLAGLSGDDSSENRLLQWQACFRMIQSHPFFGVGPFESTGEMRNYGGIGGLPPHNTIIQVFAETGIFGGITFILFGLTPIVAFYNNIRFVMKIINSAIEQYKYLCLSLLGFWVCAIFTNRVEGYQLYILVSLIVANQNLINKEVSFQ